MIKFDNLLENTLSMANTLAASAESLLAQRVQDVGICSNMEACTSTLGLKRGRVNDDTSNAHPTKQRSKVRFRGCARVSRLKGFLATIDAKGFERSNHQCRFHDAFMKACGRTLYREEWGVYRTDIMRLNKWNSDKSEVMISTPRRFGKTFRCSNVLFVRSRAFNSGAAIRMAVSRCLRPQWRSLLV